MNNINGKVSVFVVDDEGKCSPIMGASVLVFAPRPRAKGKAYTTTTEQPEPKCIAEGTTDEGGQIQFDLPPASYDVAVFAFGIEDRKPVSVGQCEEARVEFRLCIGFDIATTICREGGAPPTCGDLAMVGGAIKIEATAKNLAPETIHYDFDSSEGALKRADGATTPTAYLTPSRAGRFRVSARARHTGGTATMSAFNEFDVADRPTQTINGDIGVTLKRSATTMTPDLPLWSVIRNASGALSFNRYKKFIDSLLCGREPRGDFGNLQSLERCSFKSLPFPGVDAYSFVKCATEVFLMTQCRVISDLRRLDDKSLREEGRRYGHDVTGGDLENLWSDYLVEVDGGHGLKTLPYLELIRSRLGEVPIKDDTVNGLNRRQVANCFGILRSKLESPCLLELIWSYWHEEGMLVQSMKAISMRFQNKRSRERDPLMRFDVDPLRPLGNLLWGYIQDEQHRLSIVRRGYEYDHHYGITLQGRAMTPLRPVDSRSKFLEAFHNLLYLCSVFYRSDDDTTVIADGFPVMNAIREVHLLLAEGAHNQFGDLPSTARQEMLIEQWLLARPEMREFLGGRIMVPYSEVWMDRVDTVKRIEGWTDTTITDFHDLAVFGEQLLLSIRWGHWTDVHDPAHAANWARYWRAEIQSYVHSYRAVTGVDLTAESMQTAERFVQPSVHLRRRLEQQLAQR
jgi:hypothetical protein